MEHLSSIELAIVSHADVLLMQNWSHMTDRFELLNTLPKETRDTDFSRVRPWCLEGDARRLRQTAMLSLHAAPELTHIPQVAEVHAAPLLLVNRITRRCQSLLQHCGALRKQFRIPLRHEMHAAENDHIGVRFRCLLR